MRFKEKYNVFKINSEIDNGDDPPFPPILEIKPLVMKNGVT